MSVSSLHRQQFPGKINEYKVRNLFKNTNKSEQAFSVGRLRNLGAKFGPLGTKVVIAVLVNVNVPVGSA